MTLISTKLTSPHVAGGLMARPELVTRYDPRLTPFRLVCVAAPAGYGKTTLLCQWRENVTALNLPSGWVSLDEDDDDPARFLAYLAAALNDIRDGIAEKVAVQLQAGIVTSYKPILESCVNELIAVAEPHVLFLDDYHRISEPVVWQMTDWLVSRVPDNTCIVIASRSQPPLALSKLKIEGQLLTIGPDDLALGPAETREFVNDVKGLGLTEPEIEALSERTEGWFAGLQLVTMTVKNLSDRKQFIEEFSGTDQDITSYLGEVVLSQQPDDVRNFLLKTSILDRFCADLCNEITGATNSRTLLDEAYADNLFLVPLDRHREWYRYHHLFGDFLHTCFRKEYPEAIAETNRSASTWFEGRGLMSEAIQYSLAAEDYEKAAELVSGIAPTLVKYRGEHTTFLGLLKALPSAVLERWPENTLCWAWSLILLRDLDEAERKLRWLDRYCEKLDGATSPEIIAERNYVLLKTQVTRCVKLGMADDSHGARRACVTWLERWPDAPPYDLGVANNVLGIACISTFDFDRGLSAVAQAAQSFGRCGADYGIAWASALTGIILIAQGRLNEAFKVVEPALEQATKVLGTHSYSVGFLSLILADILYERGELTAATAALERGFPSALDHGILESGYAAYTTMAKILFAKGDLDAAIETLRDGERLGGKKFSERLPLALRGEQIALYLRTGNVTAAECLAKQFGFIGSPKDVVGMDAREVSREIPKIAACRLRIASGQADRALPALTTLIKCGKSAGRTRKVIELLVLKSKAAWLKGDEGQALRAFAEALALGEPEEFFRVFIDEQTTVIGAIVTRMIEKRSAIGNGDHVGVPLNYLRRLAKTLGVRSDKILQIDDCAKRDTGPSVSLTKRELDIVRHIGAGLSNRELAHSLFVSEQTIKWHLSNVYNKLGVHNRTGAVAVAHRMKLID
jgi:ATP/maltotriose-dependent transcriptional regulator MalT